MEAQTQSDIRSAYKDEYREAALKDVKGIGGWMLRLGDRFSARVNEIEKSKTENWKMPIYMLGPSFLGAYGVIIGMIAAPVVTVAAIGAAIWTGRRAWKKADAIAEAAIDRDMDSGALPARYNAEILQPKIDKLAKDMEGLQQVKSSLPAPGAASADFGKAVSPPAPAVDAPENAASAPKPPVI